MGETDPELRLGLSPNDLSDNDLSDTDTSLSDNGRRLITRRDAWDRRRPSFYHENKAPSCGAISMCIQ
jgi:hypothetical protein